MRLWQLLLLGEDASAPITWTFVGSCVTNFNSLNFGALSAGTIQAGDLAVYVDMSTSASDPPGAIPSGFTNEIDTLGNTGSATEARGMVSLKKLAGSEGSVTGSTMGNQNKVGLVFRPSSTSYTVINSLDEASQVVDTNPTAQACDPSAETVAAIVIGIAGVEGGSAAFSTFSPAADGTVATADGDLLVGYKIYNSSPASVSIDMNDLGDPNWLASLYITVS